MSPIDRLLDFLYAQHVEGIFIKGTASIRYFTGFTGDDSLLYLDKKRKVIITDSRYTLQVKNEAPSCEILEHKEGLFKEAKKLGLTGLVGIDGNYFSYVEAKALEEELTGIKLKSLDLVPLRQVKTETEIKLIKTAVAISDEAFRELLPKIEVGRKESDLAAELEYNMRKHGSERTAFATIVASGERSALPHGIATEKKINKGDFVTFDFGAIFKGYRSDITRTVVMGEPKEWQKEIYDIVLRANLLGEKTVKAGFMGKEVDAIVRDFITKSGYGEYFGHGLGHGVGLDIHELPILNKRCEIVLEPKNIVTVEPGIYISGKGGVRIEDTVVVTDEGCEVLTSVDKQLLSL